MGITYRPDDDLAFLQYCTEDDIRQLAEFIIYDKDGDERIASEILAHPDFKARDGQPDQRRKSWKLVAGELQHFGGDTLVNLFRRQGVPYREVLTDVCGKLKVKYDKQGSTYDVENSLIERLVELSWSEMSEEQRQATLDSLEMEMLGGVGWSLVNKMIRSSSGSLAWSSWLAQSAQAVFSPFSLKAVGAGAVGFLAQRGAGVVAGPLAAAALAVPMITGTAYRVTVPATIQIAYMRRKYEQQDRF